MGIEQKIISIHQDPAKGLWVKIGLFPVYLASLIYGAVMRLRRWCYRIGIFRVKRLDAVVVCVGNITTGGTGKTPAVVHLVRRLIGAGIKTAVISRGYGYRITGDYLIVSGPDGLYRQAGQAPDEALMTARKLPGVPVVVSPARYRAGKVALEGFGAEVVVMDDGFQHLGLFRDIDILVVDADNPLGNGLVLPAGPLREPLNGMRRADVVWLSGRQASELPERFSAYVAGKPVVRAHAVVKGLVTLSGKRVPPGAPAGMRVLAFSGIARPQRFFEALEGLGAATADRMVFADHHRYADEDVDLLNRRAREAGAEIFVTTEKDLARLPGDAPFTLPVGALVMDLAITGDDALVEMIVKRVKEKAA
ncbi:MAG: tetraacyldisaccharide 4'-kinase [Deltaproteobacteria bacterium]|nr:tetraacyldisaccharide 4'-kinase [Candidatus Zymogenaceae bacterium]